MEREEKIKWQLVKVDTPIYVSEDEKHWFKAYYAGESNGKVEAWERGMRSFEADGFKFPWRYAKLR